MTRYRAFAAIVLVAASCSEPGEVFPGSSSSGAPTSSTGAGQGGSSAGGATSSSGEGGGAVANHGFPDSWIDGTMCGSEPDIMVWAYADDTYILRQSLCTNFEGPFLYLLRGKDMVLLQDTGTGAVDVYAEVAALVAGWAADAGVASLPVLVTHSHSHGDHVGGDGQFQGQAGVTVVGTSTGEVISFFGFASWPSDTVTLDLGERVLDVIGIPGHQGAHLAVYDRRHQLLLTGDTLYPGRLYISDFDAYQASIQRLVDFTQQSRTTWVLGTHIEMTSTPGQDFPFGSDQHPSEHVLQLTSAHLVELNDAVIGMSDNPQVEAHDDFIVYPL
jgi:glyoxylase-like metal-dependent hydrolase (beta-lactamase superfamily II)